MTFKEIQCYIEDVQFHDYWNDAQDIPYNNAIVIIIRDAETNEVYSGAWTEADVRKFVGIEEKIGSRQMIDIAALLRNQTGLLRLRVPDTLDKIEITPELLKQNQEEQLEEENASKFRENEHLGKRRK